MTNLLPGVTSHHTFTVTGDLEYMAFHRSTLCGKQTTAGVMIHLPGMTSHYRVPSRDL